MRHIFLGVKKINLLSSGLGLIPKPFFFFDSIIFWNRSSIKHIPVHTKDN